MGPGKKGLQSHVLDELDRGASFSVNWNFFDREMREAVVLNAPGVWKREITAHG